MSVASALFFLTTRGDILCSRIYRDQIDPAAIADTFRHNVINNRTTTPIPVINIGALNYMYIKQADVYFLAVAPTNCNAACTFALLVSLNNLFRHYFGEVNEHSLRNNFVVMFELLDEVVDFGYVQLTDPATLKQYIYEKGVKSSKAEKKKAKEGAGNAASLTLQVTGKTSWRSPGIAHKKNEVYVDVIETMHVVANADGSVASAEVSGKVMMRVQLSGMPDLKLGLVGKVEDWSFHQCVNLARWEAEGVINFTPPEGELELMSYRCADNINVPFSISVHIKEVGRSKVTVGVALQSKFTPKLHATKVAVLIPVPDATATASIVTEVGKAKLKQDKKQRYILWKINKMNGGATVKLAADVSLVANTRSNKAWVRPPLSLEYQLPQFSASGLKVSYLRVFEKGDYNTDKWVRKLCVAKKGGFQVKATNKSQPNATL